MRTVFRPFCKVLKIFEGTTSGIQLLDSSGSPVSCNFVSLETSSGGDDSRNGLILLEPSGMTTGVPEGPSGIVDGGASSMTGSGMLGDMCRSNNGIAQLVLGIGDRVKAINVTNTTLETSGTPPTGDGDLAVVCFITYGNVNVQNPLKDVQYGRGT